MKNCHELIEALMPQMTSTLQGWIRIPSIKAEPAEGAPFGLEARRALDQALADAESLGFAVRNFDGYAGDARIGPEGVNPLGILVHLDVVPVGTGWAHDPFGAEIVGDKMYGRGTADDKGPAAAALYAIYAYVKAGLPLNREIRLIFGCDEESGMTCMEHYAQVCDMPETGFSPDASFPLINTEKASLQLTLHGDYAGGGLPILQIDVGERRNVIPGEAKALLAGTGYQAKVAEIAEKYSFQVTAAEKDGNTEILSVGIPGHAAYPEGCRNALGQLMIVLRDLGAAQPISAIADRIGIDTSGSLLGVACSDETSGPLTCNLGILRYNPQEGLFATLDLRCPMLSNLDKLTEVIQHSLGDSVRVEIASKRAAHHVSPHSKLVQSLLRAYHEETGLPAVAESTGGGTYAHTLKEGVAFGCCFPGEPDMCHQANEYASLEELKISMKVFARALKLLNT